MIEVECKSHKPCEKVMKVALSCVISAENVHILPHLGDHAIREALGAHIRNRHWFAHWRDAPPLPLMGAS
jgi:hypothetical protein